jgi:hypothetical protein
MPQTSAQFDVMSGFGKSPPQTVSPITAILENSILSRVNHGAAFNGK